MEEDFESIEQDVCCNVSVFSKSSLIKSKSFKDKKDLLFVLLDDDKLYSKDEVNCIIDNYLKRSCF